MEDSKIWYDSYYRRRYEGLSAKNISTVRSLSYEKLTWRLFSTSGIRLTGIFTVGSWCGFFLRAPA
jgi:hypothetical protein